MNLRNFSAKKGTSKQWFVKVGIGSDPPPLWAKFPTFTENLFCKLPLRRKPFLCATSEVAQGRCDWPVSGGEHWNFYENKHLCYMIYFSHSFWMTLYCPSKYFTFAWCDWQTSSLRLPNQRHARDVITPERKEIQLSLWVLMWKMRAGLERDNRESCFCTKRATFACTIGQSLQQLGFYSTWFPRDKGGFS